MAAVLVACEESQAVCKAFRERGIEAWSCDIQECSGGHPEWHICGDVLPLLNGNCSFLTQDGHTHTHTHRWDLIIAHPPCTYLSNAGACRMYKLINGKQYIDADRYWRMVEARAFFELMLNADCDHIAVENPLPMRIAQLPPPSQTVQPYEYGHPYSKRTLLWLKGLDPLVPTNIVKRTGRWISSNTSLFAKGKGGGRGVAQTQKDRSKTFPGIAKAMADQWGGILNA